MIRKVELLAFSGRHFGSIIEGSSPSRCTTLSPFIVHTCLQWWARRNPKNTKKPEITGFFVVILWAILQLPSQVYLANAKKIFDFFIFTIVTFFISLEPTLEHREHQIFQWGVRFLIANFNDFFWKTLFCDKFVTNSLQIFAKKRLNSVYNRAIFVLYRLMIFLKKFL